MEDRLISRQVVEISNSSVPPAELSGIYPEVLSHAQAGDALACLTLEVPVTSSPPEQVENLQAETLVQPRAGTEVDVLQVEILRRDTAASALVATGMNAFTDTPWPGAQQGIFAFAHDWAEPLVERLEWHTKVVRLASGNESRQACRRLPRRSLTYQVGHAGQADGLVADWLADHGGKRAWWPLPHYGVHLKERAESGAVKLSVTAQGSGGFEWPMTAQELSHEGLRTPLAQEETRRWVMIRSGASWQIVSLREVTLPYLWLAEPLARGAGAGSTVIPLVWGTALDPADLTQWVPGVVNGAVVARLGPGLIPEDGLLDDPVLDGLPVWPDGNWRDDPGVVAEVKTTIQDLSPADPWVRRDDPWAMHTFMRRYLAGSFDEIMLWRARLWRTQGRLSGFWLPDGLAPVLYVTQGADIEAGFLPVSEKGLSAFWHRPGAGMVIHPDGERQYVLTAGTVFDGGGVLVLRSGLEAGVPPGSRIIRLARCRLDHDAIELYWHHPTLVETALTARQLPEPRGQSSRIYT